MRRAETTVELPSGGSFAIAGLMQHTTKQVIDGFPGVKDMPVLGALFRSRDFQNDETELVVLVSAYLVAAHRRKRRWPRPPTASSRRPIPKPFCWAASTRSTRKDDKPLTPQAAAPVGFVVR